MPPGRNPAAHAVSRWKPTDGAPAGVGLGVAGLPVPARRTPRLRPRPYPSGVGRQALERDQSPHSGTAEWERRGHPGPTNRGEGDWRRVNVISTARASAGWPRDDRWNRQDGGVGATSEDSREQARAAEDLPDGRSRRVRGAAQRARRSALTAARGLGHTTVAGARAVGRGGRTAATRFRDYTNSRGAGATGLGRLTQLHASQSAGDAVLALALAGTIFYSPTSGQARSQVGFFLLLTMVPFVLLAPLIGPLLDRFRHGRRWAIGTTLAVRAFLSWVVADLLREESNWLFPAALTILVASRAYTVSRAAGVPRLLPAGTTLVEANSRMSMAGVVGAVLGGGLGGLAMLAGPAWALRLAFVVYAFGTVQAIRLPARVDSAAGEIQPEDTAPLPVAELPRADHGKASERPAVHEYEPLVVDAFGPVGRLRRRARAIPWPVRHALWSTGGTRILTGFLITFLPFLAKEQPLSGLRPELVLGIVLAGSGFGNALGNVVAARLEDVVKDHRPERVAMISVLAALLAAVAAAVWYDLWSLALVGIVQGVAAQVAKLCFDALVQRDIPEHVRASVFAWSETVLQMQWVLGGALGIVLPLQPHLGFGVAAVGLVLTIVLAARTRRLESRPARRVRPAH